MCDVVRSLNIPALEFGGCEILIHIQHVEDHVRCCPDAGTRRLSTWRGHAVPLKHFAVRNELSPLVLMAVSSRRGKAPSNGVGVVLGRSVTGKSSAAGQQITKLALGGTHLPRPMTAPATHIRQPSHPLIDNNNLSIVNINHPDN
jgi:hypothetical protein